MFARLMDLMNEGKTYSRQELSRELGVSEETLHNFIEHLSGEGLLSRVDLQQETCVSSVNCANCKMCKEHGCGQTFKNMPTLWELKRS